jgi:cation:H+ antiporter
MLLPILALIGALALLLWSADRFVDGASSCASRLGVSPLLIGMVIVGFGTSAPEMLVSGMAAADGKSGIALGNAYGSNIANIALILGLTALISPIAVHSQVLRRELPVLVGVTLFAGWLLHDGVIARTNALALLLVFAALMAWTVWESLRNRADSFGQEIDADLDTHLLTMRQAIFWTVLGLLLLIASSRVLVWAAVEIAQTLGISDLIIGLSIVAVGTSLPELASSIAAARKGQHDIALGNILGSNLFNTLAVVGLAGMISPLSVPPEILQRDLPVMVGLTLSLFVLGYGFRGPGRGRINRIEGGLLLAVFLAYTGWLIVGG